MTASAMMLPVNIHELLGLGIRAARQRRGWRQQDASRGFREHGLRNWTPIAVSQVEAGVRKPSIGDLLLVCAALNTSLAGLVPDDVDELVDMGSGATMTAAAVKAILAGRNPDDLADTEISVPGDEWMADLMRQSQEEQKRVAPLLHPIWARREQITRAERRRAFLPASEAEQRAAERLDVTPAQVKAASRVLWDRSFEEERDARAGDDVVTPLTLQARRGHATRAMLAELRTFLNEVYTPSQGGR